MGDVPQDFLVAGKQVLPWALLLLQEELNCPSSSPGPAMSLHMGTLLVLCAAASHGSSPRRWAHVWQPGTVGNAMLSTHGPGTCSTRDPGAATHLAPSVAVEDRDTVWCGDTKSSWAFQTASRNTKSQTRRLAVPWAPFCGLPVDVQCHLRCSLCLLNRCWGSRRVWVLWRIWCLVQMSHLGLKGSYLNVWIELSMDVTPYVKSRQYLWYPGPKEEFVVLGCVYTTSRSEAVVWFQSEIHHCSYCSLGCFSKHLQSSGTGCLSKETEADVVLQCLSGTPGSSV